MDQPPPGQASTPPTPQQIEQPPPPPGQAPPPPTPTQPSSSSVPPPTTSVLPSSSSTIPSSPNPNPSPPTTQSQSLQQQQTQLPQQQQQQQIPSSQNSQTRLPFNRPWQQPSSYPHFSSHLQSIPPPHSSSSSSSSSSTSPSTASVSPFSSSAPSTMSAPPAAQRGGMAIGVPAHHPSPSPPSTSFSSLNSPSFGQQFGGLARNSANVPESVTSPSTSQGRQPIQGIQGMGTIGSFGSVPQMRPGGMSGHHQQRPVQSSARPLTTPNTQSSTSQNSQGHGMLRVSSAGSPGLSSPSTSQSVQPHNQPWLSSGSQGKPPLPSPPFRPQMNPLSMQQRSHIPQQPHHQVSTASQQPQASLSLQQQQPSSSHPLQEHYGQQFPPSRVTQSLTHQQQNPRGSGLGNQKPSSLTAVQPSTLQAGLPTRTPVSADSGDSCNRILSKRSIQEMVTQIDPSERLDPGVEDILVDIADEFVESITTFGCSLAKHRKSNTLEAKDILLHLERNWHMTLPGFSGDEIKSYRKPFASEVHRERLAVIKRSIASADTANPRSSAGQGAGNVKGHPPKAPVNIIGSPNPKIREAA